MIMDTRQGTVLRESGFTLIEVILVITLIAILALIAYPSYQTNIRKAKRNDAVEALLRIQLAEEKWRVSDTDYATLVELGNPSTKEGLYAITIPVNSATGYTIIATAIGDQANDNANGTLCTPMVLQVSAGGETKSPASCW